MEGLEFDTGSDLLRDSSNALLEQVASSLKGQPDLTIVVQGHTDSVGEDAANKVLSERRAKAVIQRLVSLGMTSSQLRAEGAGETQPIASNDTPEGRQRNRRVLLMRDY